MRIELKNLALRPNPPKESTKISPVPVAHKPKQATEDGAREKVPTQHKALLNKSADSLLEEMKAIGAKLHRLQQKAQVSTTQSTLRVTPLTAADMTDLMREVEEVRADTQTNTLWLCACFILYVVYVLKCSNSGVQARDLTS